MAALGLARTVYKARAGKASARIEYITGQRVLEQDSAKRQLRYIKEGREDLVMEGTRNLPPWANNDPHVYFRAAEQYERRSENNEQRRGVAFEEWKITLPQELTRGQNRALVESMIDAIAGIHLPCTYAFHEPATMDGATPQPHVHLILSARMNDEHARTAETHFKRWNKEHPERGGARKDPAFWHQGAVKHHRILVADILNLHLERHGISARVHPDSLRDRGIDREPEPKLLPSESAAYRAKREVSPAMAKVLQIREDYEFQKAIERVNAQRYWGQRKKELGITRDMDPEHMIAQVLLKRHGSVERVPEPYRGLLQEARQARGAPAVLRALEQLTRQMGVEETPAHGDLRIRLQDQAQGMGR